ncbi:uncharacterized protein LOC112574238 isoform X3 [Pomacea canaliculata]|nr:uncharacterized protein LOC112574238 isoform X3 [Pomacea canaliculata]
MFPSVGDCKATKADSDGSLTLPASCEILSKLYANHGVRIRMVRRRPQREKIPSVRQLIEQLAKKHDQLLAQEMAERLKSSSSTSTVPLSSSELFYGNELSHHEFTEDITTGDTVTFDRERDKQKLKELDVGNRHMINRGGINRKAANFDKVTYDYEREEQHPVGNSVSSLKQFPLRTNGLKNNSLRGEQYFNHRNSAGREDDLVAMGTLWSPGQAQTRSSYISTSSCKSSNGTCTSSAATTTGTLPIRRSLNLSTSCSTRQLLTSSTSQPNATAFALSSMGNVKSSREVEPRYADPLAGAPSLFQQRLMELAALEAETVRWEKAKKVKKKSKQDS